MWKENIGKRVKIVHKDGYNFSVNKGKILEYDEEKGFYKVFDEIKQQNIIIKILNIEKLEVQQ